MNAIIRRTFTSRSAIRAPPAPSSSLSSISPAPLVSRAGRVAMLPKATETSSTPASTSTISTYTTTAAEQDVLPQVGSFSIPGEQPILKLGESH